MITIPTAKSLLLGIAYFFIYVPYPLIVRQSS